jgi:hypothetical protein
MPDQLAKPRRDTEAPWWSRTLILTFAFLAYLFYLTVMGSLSPDGTRSCLLLFVLGRYLGPRWNRPGPLLTKRTCIPSIIPFPPQKGGSRRIRRRRYPRHYHLRRRIARRNPLLTIHMELTPWDSAETKTHMKHRWISNPRATYGTYYDTFCRSLDPTAPTKSTTDGPGLLDSTEEPPDVVVPDCEAYRKTPGDSTREQRADSKHQWISTPLESYGTNYARFCDSFDPTAPLRLLMGDFASTTKVKEKFRMTMRDFAAATKVTTLQDQRALVAATLLQGDAY